MTPLRAARIGARTERGVIVEFGRGRTCRISLLGPALVRVLHLQDGKPRLRRTWTVLAPGTEDTPWAGRDRLDETAWPPPELTLDKQSPSGRGFGEDVAAGTNPHPEGEAERLILRTEALTLEIALDPFALTWRLPDGRVFAADRKHGHEFARYRPDLAHHMARHPGDRYYGLGDKTGPLDLHGRRLRIAALDSLGYDPERGDPLYKHWPFLITRDGATGASYGLYYDNGAAAACDLGCAHDNYYGLFRSYEARDGDLDYYLWLGPTLRDVTPGFLALTGRTAMPPRWTLGYAQTAMALADEAQAQATIEAFIGRCEAEHLPISSFHFGSGYTSIGPKRYVFHWNRDKFPDAPALIRRFHAAGMHVVANLKPCLLSDHPRYADVAGIAVHGPAGPIVTQFWDGEGAHLDFTNPAAVRWWQDGLAEQVLAFGIDAGWNDNNEYPLWDEDAACDGFGESVPLERVRAVQALLMTRATLERQRAAQPGQRSFTITRAGCPGIQRYAQTWSGDNTTSWDTLRWNLRTGLQMALSGMINTGHDVGGFAGPVPDAELLIRWTQAGLLHPRFIMNSWKPGGVFNSPFLHPDATASIVAAIRLRYRLLPYLYSLMAAAAAHHAPVLQPTFVPFEADDRCFDDCDELMLGPLLLAAPVVRAGERERRLYLPAGPDCWFDVHTGARHAAGADIRVPAPLDRLPLLAAAGAIIPATARDGLHDEPSRELRLFPGPDRGESRFLLHEDDGVSASGPRTTVALNLSWTPAAITLRAEAAGGYALRYDAIAVVMPPGDGRRLQLDGALLRR